MHFATFIENFFTFASQSKKRKIADEPGIEKEYSMKVVNTDTAEDKMSAVAYIKPGSLVSSARSTLREDFEIVSGTPTQSPFPVINIKPWDKKSGFSDLIRDGLRYLMKKHDTGVSDESSSVVMLYESPSSSSTETSFFNSGVFRLHDYPPAHSHVKSLLEPLRYAMVNGSAYPVFLRGSSDSWSHSLALDGLLEHWEAAVPQIMTARPRFVSKIRDADNVYAYFPCESVKHHLNDPRIHFHLAGKDSIPLMTLKTPSLLPDTKTRRPCVAKCTHGFSSKGVFIIRDDEDEARFLSFLEESGNQSYVVTEYVEIERNVACHFFIHPGGDLTFIGSNENIPFGDGSFSRDSYLMMSEQDELREMQIPYVLDVTRYCLSLGYWGFCGVDVVFDKSGQGYILDVNPRVTRSSPPLMVATLMKDKYGFEYGIFRSDGNITFCGTPQQLFREVAVFNQTNEGRCRVVLFSVVKSGKSSCTLNVGAYGNSLNECLQALDRLTAAPC